MAPTAEIPRVVVDPEPHAAGGGADREHPPERRPARRRRWARRALVALVLLGLVALVGPRMTTLVAARGEVVHAPSDLPRLADDERRAAIVLGAGVVGERPSPLLQERIDGAIELLDAGRIDLIVMSGDNSTQYYDEPTVMRRSAIDRGVPDELVAADYAGRRTWDSCVRARDVFGLDEAVVVTNAFHVDRAVVSCRAAGVDAVGYSVPDSGHAVANRAKWRARELPATGRALLDAWVLRPEPAVDGARIDPYDPCALRDSLAPSDAEASADRFTAIGC